MIITSENFKSNSNSVPNYMNTLNVSNIDIKAQLTYI
jgi:hypothetical protein